MRAAAVLKGTDRGFDGDRDAFVEDVRRSLYASKICSYAQGFQLLRAAAAEHGVAPRLRQHRPDVARRLHHQGALSRAHQGGLRRRPRTRKPPAGATISPPLSRRARNPGAGWSPSAVQLGVPVPAFGSALAYYDGYRSEVLPANLLQAQRDYFGAHTYERVDRPGPRRVLPHQLDRTRGHHGVDLLQRLMKL